MSRKIFNGGAVSIGADGRDGKDGKNGADGLSPTVELEKENGVTTMTVTDAEGTHSAQIMDGADGQNGQDGVSPVVELIRDDARKCVTVTVTDAEGIKTAQIYDGADGQDGQNGTVDKGWDTDPIVDFTVTELSARVVVDVDMAGQPFSLRRAIVRIYQPADTDGISKQFVFGFNTKTEWAGKRGVRSLEYPKSNGQILVTEIFFDRVNNMMYPVSARTSINSGTQIYDLGIPTTSAGLYVSITEDNGYTNTMLPADCVVLATYGNYIIPGTRVVVWGERE